MKEAAKLGARAKTAILIWVSVVGIGGGLVDALPIINRAGYLFTTFFDRLIFVVFAIGVYGVVGLILGALVSLIPPKWLMRRDPKETQLGFFYLICLVAFAGALLVIVEQINFLNSRSNHFKTVR